MAKTQLTIIGLGQIGASIGLALADQVETMLRVGHDREPTRARAAERLGAVDKIVYNLPAAVRQADLVLLCLPLDQIRETLRLIAPDLKDDAVVLDTAPLKQVVLKWASELVPPGRHFVGLTPVINPAYLHETKLGAEAARPDLFRKGLMAIVTPRGVESAAIKLAVDLTQLVGATPLFADPLEIDGLMAATHLMPRWLAAGLLNTTVDQPGWTEGRKFAGRAYAQATSPALFVDPPNAVVRASLLNRESLLRVMDNLIAWLQAARDGIAAQQEEALVESLESAVEKRERWWSQRLAADWASDQIPQADIPSIGETLGRMFLGRRSSEE